jgi:ATP-binding protein involved in chromosome partitioning
MSSPFDRSAVERILTRVIDPELRRSIIELGMVDEISLQGERIEIRILLTIAGCPMRDRLEADVRSELSSLTDDVRVHFGVMNQEQRDAVKKIVRGEEKVIPFAQPGSTTRVIGIASGKGGVGKSTLTANIAISTAKRGFTVGILDSDVYGHSIPRLLNLLGRRPTAIDQLFIPPENYGVKVVSMEMFKPDRSDPIAYRGPLLHRVLEQLLTDAYWGDLDFLFIDLPPGTGDIAISLGQLIPQSEIVVVTTPQVAASEVAERAGRIAHQLNQRILGVIENMSNFPCPSCGQPISLFGSGGGKASAAALSTLIGEQINQIAAIPFSPDLREGGDSGTPIVVSDPASPAARAIDEVVEFLMKRAQTLVGKHLKVEPTFKI